MREPLTYEMARTAAERGVEFGRQDERAVCVVVVNRSGIVKALLADDGVGVLGIETARRKAYTSAVSGKTTAQFASFAASPTMQNAPVHLVDSQLLPVAGGVPIITADGEVIGAIGVGGADDTTDGVIAGKARDAISDLVG